MMEEFCKGCEAKAGVPWQDLLEVLLDVLGNCFNSEAEFMAAAKSPTVLQRAGLRIAARRTLGIRSRRQRVQLEEAVFEHAAGCNDDQLGGCFAEASTYKF